MRARAKFTSPSESRLAASAISMSLALSIAIPALAQPATISVPGTVRDFRKTDAEFVPPGYSSSIGHVAGNIALTLNASGKPAFDAGGFEVDDQWRNDDWQPIAPHLFASGGPGVVKVANAPQINNNPVIDTWDSGQGPYGPSNRGPAPEWETGSPMPAVAAPSPLPPWTENILYEGSGTSTLSASRYCKTFTVKTDHTLQIDGDIYIYCTETFKVENDSHVVLLPGARLTIYLGKDGTIQNYSKVGMTTWNPAHLTLINLGTTTIVLENGSEFCGTIISPNAPLHVKNGNQFYGRFTGKSVILDNEAGFHIDASTARDSCDRILSDTAGLAGGGSTGGIFSAQAFARWYTDTLFYNLSAVRHIILRRNSQGVYEYISDAFFPIDNRLYGNQGQNHNYYFTFAFSVKFIHRACDDRFLQFEGSDDAWAFIEDDLAMDLGGIMPGTEQYIEFDRFDLVDGDTYWLHFFFANRNPSESTFRLRTNLDLVKPVFGTSASPVFD